jgi:ribA/ribD-fused uncharacterized protein
MSDQALFQPPSVLPPGITSFTGQYRFLANPFECPVSFEGDAYSSAEHAFQAAKSLDWRVRQEIAITPGWREAKQKGRVLRLRPGWDRLRRAVMLQVVLDKFIQNPDLAGGLAETGGRFLLEGNWWGDTDWGAVREGHRKWSPDLPWWHEGGQVWAGHNWLGLTLMTVRTVLS